MNGGADAALDARSDVALDAPAHDAGTCDATFCDDFDDGAIGATWTQVLRLDSGWLSLGPPAVSPPNALVIALPDGGAAQGASLVKDFPKASAITCSFSMLGEVLPSTANAGGDVLSFHYAGSGSVVDTDVLLSASSTGLSLREDVGFADGGCACPGFAVGPAPIANGLFTRVEMKIDFATAHVFVNDTEVLTHAVTGSGAAAVRVSFGVDRPDQPMRARFDDFRCTVTP